MVTGIEIMWVLTTALFVADITSAPANALSVQAVTIEGSRVDGEWSGVDASGALVLLQQGQRRSFKPAQLMRLRWLTRFTTTAPSPDARSGTQPASQPDAPPPPTVLYLADGGRLGGQLVGSDPQRIELETALAGRLSLPLTNLAGMRLAAHEQPDAQTTFDRAMANRDASQDMLIVLRDRIVTTLRGVVETLTPEGGTFRWRERRVPIRRDRVYGIVFAAGVHRPHVAQACCMLNDGQIWAGRIAGGDSTSVELELTSGLNLHLPIAQLSEIRFRSDRVRFLTELEPTQYVFEPFVTTRWGYRKNRSVANQILRIGDQTFERGIGMHSQARLIYTLAEPFSQLAAVIGIDEAVGALGNVIFRVLADDAEVFNSGPVTGRHEPRPILVPLAGAKQLQLIVDFAEALDVGDQANWADARLIK